MANSRFRLASPLGRRLGRFGDSEVAHVSPGETIVPVEVAAQPAVRRGLSRGFRRAGIDPSRFVVRSGANSINPRTGAREFFSFDRGFEGFGGSAGDFDDTDARDAFQGPESQDVDNRDGRGGFRNRFPGGFMTAPTAAPPDPTAGLPPDFFTQDAAFGRFRTSPGFEFRFNRGVDALDRSAARFGSLFSGNQAEAITELGQNLATAEYADYYNRLAALAGVGQASAAQTGAFGVQTAASQGRAILAGGAAQTAGAIGVGNAIQGGISNALFLQFLNQQGQANTAGVEAFNNPSAGFG